MLILSNSLRHGLRRSLWTVCGDLCANSIQMTVAAFGLAAIIASSATAFVWIKWLGVAYLAWIGLRLLLSPSVASTGRTAADPSAASLFRLGFITSLSNPFAVIFFGALFPQFIHPDAAVLPQLAILGATYLLVDGVLLLAWGWLGTRAKSALSRIHARWINRLSGSLMIGAAMVLAGKDLSPQK